MSQAVERAEALRKIRMMSSQTLERGSSEAEVNFAMDRMNKLMKQFSITMDEVSMSEYPCITLKVDTGAAVDQAVNHTARAIAAFCDCIYYRSKGDKEIVRDAEGKPIVKTVTRNTRRGKVKKTIYVTRRANTKFAFYGQEQDVKMAEFLFNMIRGAIELETKVYKRSEDYKSYWGPKKSASHSFQHGMAERISERLETMREERGDDIRAQETTGRDIQVIKSAYVEDQFKTTGLRLVMRRSVGPRVNAYGARHAGSQAGDRLNLSRPVSSGDSTLLLK